MLQNNAFPQFRVWDFSQGIMLLSYPALLKCLWNQYRLAFQRPLNSTKKKSTKSFNTLDILWFDCGYRTYLPLLSSLPNYPLLPNTQLCIDRNVATELYAVGQLLLFRAQEKCREKGTHEYQNISSRSS